MAFDPNKAVLAQPVSKSGGFDVKLALNVGLPKQGDPTGAFNHDRIILVPINQIERYEDNPRRKRTKEAWADFKDSVRAIGVKQPIKITQKPGCDKYQIIEGGNSRHAALEELFQETGDIKYSVIPTIFQEWDESEFEPAKVLLAHIVENEMRSEVLFWDKAQAYCKVADLMGISDESARNISDSLKSKGASISYTSFLTYSFAVNNLYKLGSINYALSIAKTLEFRKTYQDLLKLLEELGLESELDTFWDATLSAYAQAQPINNEDEPTLDVGAAIKFIKKAFFEEFPQAQVLALKKGRLPSTPSNQGAFGASNVVHAEDEATDGEDDSAQSIIAATALDTPQSVSATPTIEVGSTNVSSNTSVASVIEVSQVSGIHPAVSHDKPKSFKELTLDVLEFCKIQDLYRDLDCGLFGFYLELPNLSLKDTFDGEFYPLDRISPYARNIWWLLTEICQQRDVSSDVFMVIPNQSLFMRTFMDESNWLAYVQTSLGEPDPFAMESWMLYGQEEEFIRRVSALFQKIRQIHMSNNGEPND